MREEWEGFTSGDWCEKEDLDVHNFILTNCRQYFGGGEFLAPPTEATKKLMEKIAHLTELERKAGGVLDADTKIVSTITSHAAGYIDKDLEKIVGLQTDKPFKRALLPYGGIKMAEQALNMYGYQLDPEVKRIFTEFRKTHNDGVYDAYTAEMRTARKAHILTGLPDAYGRGRIVGDYRRVALYGVDYLIKCKERDKSCIKGEMNEWKIQLAEELTEQIRALHDLKKLANIYERDISNPARTAQEAIQALYFGYLAAVKTQNGAAMSLGRVSTFLDIYIERDIRKGILTEQEAQELIDHFVMKLRLVKFMRIKEYNELFSGDPTWVTESIGGMTVQGQSLVTKSSFRFLHTLNNLGPAPEPNLTVLWSPELPQKFKEFCVDLSIKTSAIQYENDDLMKKPLTDDYCIACCVSSMKIGRDIQFFGARANFAKCILYAINGGKDEILKDADGNPLQVTPPFEGITSDEPLDIDNVMLNLSRVINWLANLYISTLNVIHYMHDKYCYESLEMALVDTQARRILATGIAGLSCAADSLSAIKNAKVYPIRDASGLVVDFKVEGDYPKYGNNDDGVDGIAKDLLVRFKNSIEKLYRYRAVVTTTSVLTITSNVVYGKHTGNTPDGRRAGEPLAPGANPMHGRDQKGALAALQSVTHLPFELAEDGISNTFSITPETLGKTDEERKTNLITILDGYIENGGQHINVNVFNKDTLLDAQAHPEKYPQLTIRVSGYAVNFVKLTKEQQDEVISRTIHTKI